MTVSSPDTPGVDLAARIVRLADGYLTTQLLYVAVELGVAEALANDPRTSDEVAAAVGARPDALARVLRGLAIDAVIAEDDGRFSLTPLGRCLLRDAPNSVRGPVSARGQVYFAAAGGLLAAVRDGGPAFDHVHGVRFFDHLTAHPQLEAGFGASMAARSTREASAVVTALGELGLLDGADDDAVRHVVDVGGGSGVLLSAVLQGAVEATGTLLDRPNAVLHARRRFAAEGLTDRAQAVAGNFFAEVPAGGDLYLLSRVLHDWDDADATRVLAACRRAMAPGARLAVVEALLPDRAVDAADVVRMDLHMLLLFGSAAERTAGQYEALLRSASTRHYSGARDSRSSRSCRRPRAPAWR